MEKFLCAYVFYSEPNDYEPYYTILNGAASIYLILKWLVVLYASAYTVPTVDPAVYSVYVECVKCVYSVNIIYDSTARCSITIHYEQGCILTASI